MSVQAIRDAIVATLKTVPNIGRVHPWVAYTKAQADMKQNYVSEAHQQLRGWHIKRISVRETGAVFERSVEEARWLIEGFFGISDAGESYAEFDDLIEAVRDAFRTQTFDNTAQLYDRVSGECYVQVTTVDEVMFAGVLCHRCRLELPVTIDKEFAP